MIDSGFTFSQSTMAGSHARLADVGKRAEVSDV